jgi:hypothetical protein
MLLAAYHAPGELRILERHGAVVAVITYRRTRDASADGVLRWFPVSVVAAGGWHSPTEAALAVERSRRWLW